MKKRSLFLLLLFCIQLGTSFGMEPSDDEDDYSVKETIISEAPSFNEWYNICELLPEFDHPYYTGPFGAFSKKTAKPAPTIIAFSEFKRAIKGMTKTILRQSFKTARNHSTRELLRSFTTKKPLQEKYAQQLILAPESILQVQGDIHGSLHSLMRNLSRIKDLKDDFSSPIKYMDNPIGFVFAPIGIMRDELYFNKLDENPDEKQRKTKSSSEKR